MAIPYTRGATNDYSFSNLAYAFMLKTKCFHFNLPSGAFDAEGFRFILTSVLKSDSFVELSAKKFYPITFHLVQHSGHVSGISANRY